MSWHTHTAIFVKCIFDIINEILTIIILLLYYIILHVDIAQMNNLSIITFLADNTVLHVGVLFGLSFTYLYIESVFS